MKMSGAFLAATVTLMGTASMAAEVVVVSNKNLADCRAAAARAVRAAGDVPGLPDTIPLIELDSSAADDPALEKLARMRPKVVISVSSYATHMVRQVLPETWVVYALVPFPEVEGFTRDPKLVGIAALGSETDLYALASGLGKAKRLVVLHSELVSPSVEPMLRRLKEAGFSPTDLPLSQAPLMEQVLSQIVGKYDAVLLLPDSVTANPYRLRFIVTTCLTNRILTLTNDQGLVANGALCGTYVPPETAGQQAAIVAGEILSAGKPPMQPVVFLRGSRPSVSMAALRILDMQVPKVPGILIQ